MLVNLSQIQDKDCCPSAADLFPVFSDEYPDGVELADLLDRANADMVQHFEWVCRNFGDDLPADKDYSSYKFLAKCCLVKQNKALKAKIGYDDLEEGQKKIIDLYTK
jgi:hypothetical protein